MGNRQSAVDWLFQELWETPKDKLNWYAILSKAKEMEKQQIMDAVNATIFDDDIDAFEYFTETYE
jgi:hypothetical protein